MPFTNQDPATESVMALWKKEREARGWTPKDVSEQLREIFQYDIRPGEYKACEDNITRNVPLHLVIHVGYLFQIHAEDMLPMLANNEYRRYE